MLQCFANGQTKWNRYARLKLTSALEPAYRGRHRLFMWGTLIPSQGLPIQVTADVAESAAALLLTTRCQRVKHERATTADSVESIPSELVGT